MAYIEEYKDWSDSVFLCYMLICQPFPWLYTLNHSCCIVIIITVVAIYQSWMESRHIIADALSHVGTGDHYLMHFEDDFLLWPQPVCFLDL